MKSQAQRPRAMNCHTDEFWRGFASPPEFAVDKNVRSNWSTPKGTCRVPANGLSACLTASALWPIDCKFVIKRSQDGHKAVINQANRLQFCDQFIAVNTKLVAQSSAVFPVASWVDFVAVLRRRLAIGVTECCKVLALLGRYQIASLCGVM